MHAAILRFLPTAVAALLLAGASRAQTARIVTSDDPLGPQPGAVHVSTLQGDLHVPPTDGPQIEQMPGFPVRMGVNSGQNFYPQRGLVFADLDGNGDLEIINSSTDRNLYAWDKTGALLPGFPVTLNNFAQYAPSVADLDGNGTLEIVQTTRGLTSGGRLYAVDHQGNVLPGFPKDYSNHNVESCPALYDLDGNGTLEIITCDRAYPIGYIHIVEPDGTEWGGNWPYALDHVPASTPAVGDLDDDGSPEIVMLSYNSIHVLRTDGTLLPGWPRQIANANFSYQSPALVDLDGDGQREIVVGAHQTAAGCYVFRNDGTLYPGWPRLVGTWTYCPPTVTDLEGDGIFEIIDGRAGFGPGVPSDLFWVWNENGVTRPGFPYHSANGGGSEGPLTVVDVDGDGVLEIFADYNITIEDEGTPRGFLYGVDAAGNDLPGFPLRPVGFTYLNGATIADVDNDGDYELGVVSTNGPDAWVNLYTLPWTYSRTGREWPVYHARATHDGLYIEGSIYGPGDMNCDGAFDGADIDPFFLALGDPGAYAQQYPNCDFNLADMNGDDSVDGADIDPFFDCLGGGPCP